MIGWFMIGCACHCGLYPLNPVGHVLTGILAPLQVARERFP